MSKVEDYTTQGYLIPDPNDIERSIFRIDISILNTVIEMGGIEIVAQSVGQADDSNPAEFLVKWVKGVAANGLIYKIASAESEAFKTARVAELQALI